MSQHNVKPLKHCPLTKLEVRGGEAKEEFFKHEAIYYWIKVGSEDHYLGICRNLKMLLDTIVNGNKDGLKYGPYEGHDDLLKEYLPIFFGEMGKDDFKSMFPSLIHWDCSVNPDNGQRHINIKEVVEKAMEKGDYPKDRKSKLEYILSYLKSKTTHDGEILSLGSDFTTWGKFYMRNVSEFNAYISELKGQKLIAGDLPNLTLTLTGLSKAESLNRLEATSEVDSKKYDIALSFAGEQREFVEQVAQELKDNGVEVFYDDYEHVELWGKDLYQHLSNIYSKRCAYCIIFISDDYARKLWTQHELKAAQSRAFKENQEYILPVRFDTTEIDGLHDTVGYLDAKDYTPIEIAQKAIQKLKTNN